MRQWYLDVIQIPMGWMGLLASSVGLCRTTLPQRTQYECMIALGSDVDMARNTPEHFETLREKLTRYFYGELVTFIDEPIDIAEASRFNRSVWNVCRTIPFGETRSYKWLAIRAGSPSAYRAAGQSMAKNKLPIIIPCHRVVTTNGSLGGFGRGATQVDLKRRLLDLENGVIDRGRTLLIDR